MFVVVHEAVVKEQRKLFAGGRFRAGDLRRAGRLVCAALHQIRSGKAEGQVDLVHGAGADLVQRNQLLLRIQEHVQILVDAERSIDPAGDAADQVGGGFVQVKSEGIPDRGGKPVHGLLGDVDGLDLFPEPVIFRDDILQRRTFIPEIREVFQLLLQLPLGPLLADDSRVRFGLPRFQSFQFRFRSGEGLFSLVHTVADSEETVCFRLHLFKGFRAIGRTGL